jgi:hypothetical protein
MSICIFGISILVNNRIDILKERINSLELEIQIMRWNMENIPCCAHIKTKYKEGDGII